MFFSAVNSYSLALKASVMEQTEFQPKLFDQAPAISCMRTDDIFTNVLIQHGRKTVEYDENTGRRDRLTRYGQVSGRRIEQCSEIFIRFTSNDGNPKSILVTGKAGIGKTLFCQKLFRDWADNRLFQTQTNLQLPDFKFAYLLTFRNLNLLGDEELTVKEILECCSFLDDQCLRSNMDTFPLEYILDHSEEVLIIIDGFDEYFNQGQDYIAGDYHEEYPNCSERKMKIAALCAKLIRKKILKQATIMITSRPDESDKLSRIEFHRIAEVTGFSEQQVTEYIERYFRRNESFKRTVLEHITKNENLVSFAHIPVLCALMCSYFEYILKKSERLKDLPVSVSDLYNEVLNIFERNHIEKRIPNFKETTLDILSKFAADLLLKRKYLFEEEEMLRFTSKEVVENLRMSGLLHCGPPFNASLSKTRKYFCFSHLTLHEYLAACWFVKEKKIPSFGTVSTMVIQFIAGILSKSNDSVLMDELMKNLSLQFNREYLLKAKCLSEYQNKEYAKNYYHQLGGARHENLELSDMNDVDTFALLFLMDVFSSLNEKKTTHPNQALSEQPSICVKSLTICESSLTLSGVKRVCHFLRSNVCAVAKLRLDSSGLSDECVQCICRLVSTSLFHQRLFCNLGSAASLSETLKQSTCQLTDLGLSINQITDAGVASLSEALKQSTCQLTTLDLSNNHITDVGVASLSEALKQSTCQLTTLYLYSNQITDAGVASLSETLKQSTCQLTTLDLDSNQITDAGVADLSEALKQSTCQLTALRLSYNQITDAGVASLSEALKQSTCQLTTLYLYRNQITDAGVASLSEALKQSTCQLTTLYLDSNQITDAGVASLSEALKQSTCQLTDLGLSINQITDAGVASLSEALKQSTCQLTALCLSDNQITDAGVASLSEALKQSTCQLTDLGLSDNHITDAGVASLSETLKQSICQLTTLDLSYMPITDAGFASLSEALKQSTCQLTILNLNSNQITNAGVASLSEALKQSTCQLTMLYLNSNQITDTSVASLSEALKQSTCQLTNLYLNSNQITDTGVASLSEALKQSTCKLTELGLACNQITDAGAASLGEAIRQSTSQLTTLHLTSNKITYSVVASLCGMLRRLTF